MILKDITLSGTSPEAHSSSMYVIGTDDGLIDKPYQKSEILLSPGERVDILVKGTKTTGSYKLKALPYSRMGMMGMWHIMGMGMPEM